MLTIRTPGNSRASSSSSAVMAAREQGTSSTDITLLMTPSPRPSDGQGAIHEYREISEVKQFRMLLAPFFPAFLFQSSHSTYRTDAPKRQIDTGPVRARFLVDPVLPMTLSLTFHQEQAARS